MEKRDVVLLWIPIGGLLLYLLSRHDSEPAASPDSLLSTGKEADYLRYNQDGIFKDLISTEDHFRNVSTVSSSNGFMNCAVKHLASAEGHADEAISHTIAIGDSVNSTRYRELRNQIRTLRHKLQDGALSPAAGIEQVRMIRHNFESFNPSFDISKCTAF